MLASAPVFDSQAEDAALRQFDTQDTAADDDDDFGVPPPPPMPPHSHDHEAGSSSAAPAALPAMDPALASILQSITQQQAHLAAEQARLSERMLSMFQNIQDRQDSLQQQLLQDRAESRAFMALMLQQSGVSVPPVQSAPPPTLHAPVVSSILSGPPVPSVGPSLLRPVTGVHVTGSQLCLPSAASATNICCYHYCCGSICDLFCSGSSCSAASVRVSTSSSRSWIRD
jgi:hypothetical protein